MEPTIAPAREPEFEGQFCCWATGAAVGLPAEVGVATGFMIVGAACGVEVATIGMVAIVGTCLMMRLASTPAPGIYCVVVSHALRSEDWSDSP